MKHFYNKYKVEAIAEKYEHNILRLLPYHCKLNSIEMICSQIKSYVGRENKSFQFKDMIIQGIKRVSAKNWKNCIREVTNKEKEMREIDGLIDEIFENQNLIISLNSESCHNDSELMSAEDT